MNSNPGDILYMPATQTKTFNTSSIEQIKRNHPKIGRNQLCPCNSGKKYKKCCLDKKIYE